MTGSSLSVRTKCPVIRLTRTLVYGFRDNFVRGRVLFPASFLQPRLPVQGHCEWRRGLRRRSLEQETFAV